MEDKISIIIPAYNVEKYIARCIDSIKCQSHHNLEVILVNDGSTDNTLAVIKESVNNDSRFVVINQKNLGVSMARKIGIEAATGKYIGFIDSDDYIESTMFEKLLYNMLQYNADISHCGHVLITPDKKTKFFHNTGIIREQDNFLGLKDLLEGSIIEPGLCNKLYKRELFYNINYDELITLKNNEDLLLNFYLFSNSKKSIHHDFCPYHYVQRYGSSTISQTRECQLYDPLKVFSILDNLTNESYELNCIIYTRKIRQYIKIATAEIIDNPDLQNKCKQTHKEFKKLLKQILSSDFCSIKLKLMSVWVAFSPGTYRFIHNIYDKLKKRK